MCYRIIFKKGKDSLEDEHSNTGKVKIYINIY